MRSRAEVEKDAIHYNISLTKEVPKTTSELEEEISNVKRGRDLLDNMPVEVFMHIISNMDVETLINFCRTSKTFAWWCDNEEVWKMLLERDFKDSLKIVYDNNPKKNYLFLKQYMQLLQDKKMSMFENSDVDCIDRIGNWVRESEIVQYSSKPYIVLKVIPSDDERKCEVRLINILEKPKPFTVYGKHVVYLYDDQDIFFADAHTGPNHSVQPSRWRK